MNKIIPLIAILDIIAAGGLGGCNKEKNQKSASEWAHINTNKTELSFTANGGRDSAWTTNYGYWWVSQVLLTDIDSLVIPDQYGANMSLHAGWLFVENNMNKIYIQSEPNTTKISRRAIVTMCVGDVFKDIRITQQGKKEN